MEKNGKVVIVAWLRGILRDAASGIYDVSSCVFRNCVVDMELRRDTAEQAIGAKPRMARESRTVSNRESHPKKYRNPSLARELSL